MATIDFCNTHNHLKQMAVVKDIPVPVNSNRISKICNSVDVTDDPTSYSLERFMSDENARNEELFDVMKYEVNRLNSFTGKWPLRYIRPKDLSQNGFFYLQSEDKVQCAFCGIVIDNWIVGDKPLRKHMMKNPKCKFLMTGDAGNIPFTRQKPTVKTVNKCITNTKPTNTLPHKPKHPRMSDVKYRLLTYRDWPLIMLSSRQLVECGLFYTGVADFVTCFYCGGSLGNWELNDDPWTEHEKFFPDCGFLEFVKTCSKPTPSFGQVNLASPIKLNSASAKPADVAEDSVVNEVMRQACEIFPSSVVQKVAIQHFRITGKHYTSLHDLCEAVLQHKSQETNVSNNISPVNGGDETSNVASSENTKNVKGANMQKCKICMEEEMDTVFEPCHHLVACEKCALKVTKCPLCRSVLTNRIKVFLG